MSIFDTIKQMGTYWIHGQLATPTINTIIIIECTKCQNHRKITAGAAYRQYKRGNKKYLCPSCSGQTAWTKEKRKEAGERTREKWHDPGYAGVIIGKAVAKEIQRIVGDDFGF